MMLLLAGVVAAILAGVTGSASAQSGLAVPGARASSNTPIADPTPPNAPTNLRGTGAFINASVSLAWTAPVGGTPPAGYQVFVLDGTTFRLATSSATTSAVVTGLVPLRYYVFYVIAVNSVGFASPPSNLVAERAVQEPPAPGSPSPGSDIARPTAPTNMRVCGADFNNSVPMCWDASTDDVRVTGYDVFRVNGTSWVLAGSSTQDLALFIDSGLVAGRSYTYQLVAKDASGKLSPTSAQFVATAQSGLPTPPFSPSPSISVTPSPSISCAYRFSASVWSTGFAANLTVTNTGTTTINGWTVRVTFPNGTVITLPGWGATWSQTGNVVTGTNPSWNSTIPPGGSVFLGFNGTYSGTFTAPSSVTLNGTPCRSA